MRFSLLAVPSLALLATLATPAMAATGVAGAYSYVAGESDNVEKAIEKATEPMNFVVRAIAKNKLESNNHPYHHVMIAIAGTKISITTEGRAPITGTSGSTFKWTRPEDGEKYEVTLRLSGDRVEEVFAAPNGKRVNVFQPSADGKKLNMSVTVSSPKLPLPLTYKIAYKRD